MISGIERVSRPGQRTYVDHDHIPRIQGGMGTAIISTSKGVMTGHEARQQGVGGEVVAQGLVALGRPMSRIGRQPIPVPAGVTIAIEPERVTVNGPKGELSERVAARHRGRAGRATRCWSRARPIAASTAPCTG